MNILIVIPHYTLLRPEGHLHRLSGLCSLLGEHTLHFAVPDQANLDPLNDLGAASIHTFREPGLLKQRLPYFLDYSRAFKRCLKSIKCQCNIDILIFDFPWGLRAGVNIFGVPAVYFSHGVESDFTEITLAHLGLRYWPLTAIARRMLAFIEKGSTQSAEAIFTISLHDQKRFHSLYGVPEKKVHYLPQPKKALTPSLSKLELRSRLSLHPDHFLVLFHGSYSHYPNREAFEFIKDHIAPIVQIKDSNIQFIFAGTGLPAFQENNIQSLGYVHDLNSLVVAADIACVPLKLGCGAQMKMLDYAAAGLPILCTEVAANGFNLTHNLNAYITPCSPALIAGGILHLANNKEDRGRIGENGLKYITANHDVDLITNQVQSIFSNLEHQGAL